MLHIEEGLMTSVNEAVIRYIAAWNERDPERRHDLVTQNLDRRRYLYRLASPGCRP
jgi:hypothetical protein